MDFSGPDGDEGLSAPLRGVCVLDASTMLAGPYCAGLLGDFGAQVIKVEDVGEGDPMRQSAPVVDGQHLPSKSTNRNKRSIALDLRSPRGRELFRDLARRADVVVTNFRQSALQRWSIDYEDLSALNEQLVMFHLTAFGRHSDRPGFARVAEAFAGLTHLTGMPDGPPMFCGFPVADGLAGAHGAYAVMLALFERRRTGRGQLVEFALYEPVLRMLEGSVAACSVTGEVPGRLGNENRDIAPNSLYETADGTWAVVPVSSPTMWRRFCAVLGRDELAADPRFATNLDRVRHRDELNALIVPLIKALSASEFLERCWTHGVAAGRVNSMADVLATRELWESESLVSLHDDRLGRSVAMPGVVPRMSGTPGRVRWVGPEAGQDTEGILRDVLGLSGEDVDELVDHGVVGQAAVPSAPA
jgi:crotonobetainyl-CoA:carnitine CoA-transferase CaiB-like acyl-CoA transferase